MQKPLLLQIKTWECHSAHRLILSQALCFVGCISKPCFKGPDLPVLPPAFRSGTVETEGREEREYSAVCYGFYSAPLPFPDEWNNFHCHFVPETEICSIKHATLKCCLGYELRELEPLLVSTASFTAHRHGEMKVTEEEHLNQHKPNWQC